MQVENVTAVNVTMTAQTRQLVDIRGGIPGVRNTIAVAAGKGGVGKSTTAVNIAIALSETGAKVGLLDADIHGPSIPIMMGIEEGEMPDGEEINGVQRIYPLDRFGLKLMSVGFLTERNNPIIWRGPMVGKMLTTFLKSVDWGDLDYLILDLPPGHRRYSIDVGAKRAFERRGYRHDARSRGGRRRDSRGQNVR